MKKPSEIEKMEVKVMNIFFGDFIAITLFGKMIVKDEVVEQFVESGNNTITYHEMIHVRQAESTNDSWWKFYLLYIWYYIKNLPLLSINLNMPYYFIPFEIEAYMHENESDYSAHGKCEGWKKFKKLTLREKRELAKKLDESGLKKNAFFNTVF